MALAERVAELRDQGMRQAQVAVELRMAQAYVSRLGSIKRKCCGEVWSAWVDGVVSTLTASDLSRLPTQRQQEWLRELPAGRRGEWLRGIAAESGSRRRPHTGDLRLLIARLVEDDTNVDSNKAAGAIAAIRHCIGDISREELLEHLE